MDDQNGATVEKKGFNPVYLVVGLVVLGIIGVVIATKGNKTSVQPSPVTQNSLSSPETNQVQPSPEVQNPAGPVKEFTVDGSSFEFDPSTITVNKGDNVKITFKDTDGMHNLVIDGYNLSTDVIRPGGTDTISFVADKAGTFRYYCSVSNHADLGMVGTLVVQ